MKSRLLEFMYDHMVVSYWVYSRQGVFLRANFDARVVFYGSGYKALLYPHHLQFRSSVLRASILRRVVGDGFGGPESLVGKSVLGNAF